MDDSQTRYRPAVRRWVAGVEVPYQSAVVEVGPCPTEVKMQFLGAKCSFGKAVCSFGEGVPPSSSLLVAMSLAVAKCSEEEVPPLTFEEVVAPDSFLLVVGVNCLAKCSFGAAVHPSWVGTHFLAAKYSFGEVARLSMVETYFVVVVTNLSSVSS